MSKIIFLVVLLLSIGVSDASDWYDDVAPASTSSNSGGNPLKDSVGNVIYIDTNDFDGSYKCLDYKNGWVLIEKDDGDQRWINSNQIIYFYGQGKIGEVPTQDLPFAALSILGIVVAALITYRRQH